MFRRKLFYIPGFDPFPPRRYRELYRSESAAQAAISGYEISQSADGPAGWRVRSVQEAEAETQISVLMWSDIVQGSMDQGIAATYWQMLRTAWVYLRSGALWRLMQLRKGPVIAALYPVFMLLGQLLLAVILGAVVGVFAAAFHPVLALLGLVTGYGVLRGFRALDHRFFAYYLMQDYGFSAAHWGDTPPALRPRLADFEDQIAQAVAEGYDEVLVVGHSSGAHLAIEVLAALQRAGRIPPEAPLSLLTLGQVVPMVSFLPRAAGLRRDLRQLAQGRLFWLDVTAPGDGCAFALCDPVAVSGVAPPDQSWPLVISAAFTQTLSPARWKSLRWRFFRLHFQYLCAFDRPGDYDYFRITAGPYSLRARFEGRSPSASRITRPASPHRTVAP